MRPQLAVMSSARGVLAVTAAALSLLVASSPARSASSTIVGTVVDQKPPIGIESCTASLDGGVYQPNVVLLPDTRVVVSDSFALTFLDANGKVTGRQVVSPPFANSVVPGGAFVAFRCQVATERLDDGSNFSYAPAARDAHAIGNALIGIGILAAIGFLASRNTNAGAAPGATDTPTTTPTLTPTTAPSGTATSTAQATPAPVATAIRLTKPVVVPAPVPSATPPARAPAFRHF